ncbi:MAG: hypothetical protein JWN78_1130 [Bacteroidota bacterium]|nr:hypothetical protein [Bacteroidota bacterium]
MSDDKNKKDFHDRTRINVNEKYELQYWSEKFNVSPQQLKAAVEKAGESVSEVEKVLKK